MKHQDLPERWKHKIKDFLLAKGVKDRDQLNAFDFSMSQRVTLTFEDESQVDFRYAFVIEAPEYKEIAVFTEHCGYHIFFNGGLEFSFKND